MSFMAATIASVERPANSPAPIGASPIPNLWGMTIGTLCLLQLLVGALVDRPYDRGILRFYAYAVWYPLLYWMFLAVTTTLSLGWLFRRPVQAPVRWNTQRAGPAA